MILKIWTLHHVLVIPGVVLFFKIHRDTPSDLQKKAQKIRNCPNKLFAQLDLREVSAFFAIFPSKVRLRLEDSKVRDIQLDGRIPPPV